MNNKIISRVLPHGIVQKFVLYLLFLSVIPLIIVGAVSYAVSYEAVTKQANNFTLQIMEKEQRLISQLLDQIENIAINISGLDGIDEILSIPSGDMDAFTKLSTNARIGYILNNYVNLDGVVSIDLFTMAGEHYHVGETLETERLREKIRDELIERTFAQGDTIFWPGVEENIVTGSVHRYVLPATKAIQRVDHKTLQLIPTALLVINIGLDHFSELISGGPESPEGYSVILDAEKQAIYHPDASRVATKIDLAFPADAGRTEAGSYKTVVDGRESLVTHSKVIRNGWQLFSVVPVDELTARSGTIRNVTIFVMIACLLLVVTVALVFSRRVVAPIRMVCRGFDKIRNKAPDAYHPLKYRGSDEIGELVELFNALSVSIKAREATERESKFKSEFLANMSHEMRTPLNAIIGFSETILMGVFGPLGSNKYEEYVKDIRDSGTHLAGLVDDILDLSKIEVGKMHMKEEKFPITEAVQEVIKMVDMDRTQAGIALDIDLTSQGIELVANKNAIKRILLNILFNAIKFTPPEGRISVRDYESAEGEYVMEIGDTGVGIPADQHEKVFEPFGQSDSAMITNVNGTGLGLTIVKKLMTHFGGTVGLESEPGKGTKITLRFPGHRVVKPAKKILEFV